MSKKKIALVDDDINLTGMVRLGLDETGRFEVRIENNSSRAIAMMRDFKPDLALLDLTMLPLSGDEVAARMKEDPQLQDIPVIFMTANVSDAEVGADGKIGGQSFIAKPAPMAFIIETIERKLDGSSS